MEFLTNSGRQRLGDALGHAIEPGARLSIISAYFTVFAFRELREELQKVDELRFIFSEPTFAKLMDDTKEPREFVLSRRSRERGVGGTGLELTLLNNMNQQALARECAEWVRSHATFKTARKRGMIATGATYHVANPDAPDEAFSGNGCDFTLEGLGYERKPGVVMGVSHFEGDTEAAALRAMFDGIWDNPELVEEVTDAVVERIGDLYRENPPEFVYFLTLYHLFHDYMEDEVGEDPTRAGIRFEDSAVWNKLYDFQRDAVVGAIRKLERYKGCIIADSVGLGKTYEALAVIKYYQERNDRVLVLCPKRLRENWTLWTQDNDDRNPLADDRFAYTVLNHTDLSRYSGISGDVDHGHLKWGNFDLLVIDESHNFRNKSSDADRRDRYTRLIEDVIKNGRRTKVLMLSATPVNNRLLDLRNQIELITEGDDAYLAADGIPSITQVTRTAQARFNEWSRLPDEERTTEGFANVVNADYFKLLDVLTIARSRKHIMKYYGASSGTFPTRRPPLSFQTPIDAKGELPPIAELNDMIARLTFAQYRVLSYVRSDRRAKYEARYGDTWGKDFESQVHRTNAVANLMRVNALKRMESSVNSFRITLGRILDACKDLRLQLDNPDAINHGAGVTWDGGFDDEEDAEEFEAGAKVRVDLRDVDPLRLGQDLDFDIATLNALLAYANVVTPERDAKLIKLREFIAKKVCSPYNPGNRKVLVFSAFADTTGYLFDQLAPWMKDELGMECAEVNGDRNRTYSLKLRRITFEDVLARFSPVSKELSEAERSFGEIDIVFATDCISEGQNLQDCDCLVNYDIHWNPVRIIQRFGRIDRLGSTNAQVQLVNFWPDIDLDEYIRLEGRVKGRMALLDASATGEENVFEGKGASEMNDLTYRRSQLEQLKHEVLDLEDVNGGISITDFTFDDFRVELQRYASDHPGLLENSPVGLHAVVPIPDGLRGEVAPGCVFCLEQRDRARDPKDTNPIFPYYVVYVTADGARMTKHAQPKAALDIMRAACSGNAEPVVGLCREFNKETRDGTQMDAYTELLNAVVSAITGVSEEKGIESLFSLGEVGGGVPLGFDDYSLVSFVVLK